MNVLLRLLLHLFPRSFRDEYGAEWTEAALARGQAIRSSGLRAPGARLLLLLLKDTLRELPATWKHRHPSTGRGPNPPSHHPVPGPSPRASIMDQLLTDLRFALRSLRKNPGFAAVATLTLALGIGANAAVFAVVDGVLLEPLPYPEPDRLAVLSETDEEEGDRSVPWSVQNLRDVAERTEAFQGVAGYTWLDETLTGLGEPELVYAVGVTTGLLDVLGTPPVVGRDIRPEEALAGAPRTVLVSHRFWTERLEGDPRVVGKTLQLSGLSYEIVGVAPEGFAFPSRADFWVGGQWPEDTHPRDRHFLRAVGRLRPGTSLERAQAEMTSLALQLNEENEGANPNRSIYVQSLTEYFVGDVRAGLLILLGAVGMVLLIACANVANLLLARGSTRIGEMAVRSTLGASRGTLLRQLVVESLVLGGIGGGGGLLVALGGLGLLEHLALGRIPRMSNVELDASVFLFTAVLALFVALLFGIFPALKLSRGSIATAIRRSREGDLQLGRRGLARSTLLAGEVALSLALLLSAGLFMRSFARIRSIELGFDATHVQQFTLTLPPAEYDPPQAVEFYRTLQERIAALPGVETVGMNSGSPLGRSHTSRSFVVPGRPEPERGDEPVWLVRVATPGYFASMGIPILRGRGIESSDGPGSNRVVVISETAANRFWPDEDPVGTQIEMEPDEPLWTIVGVVGDVRSLDVTTEVWPEAYYPHAQWSQNTMTVEVLTAGAVPGLAEALKETVRELDPALPLYWMEGLQTRVDESMASDRFYLLLIGTFAGLALILASVGLYGVVAYLVSRRTREIGIRVALGAGRRDVAGLVLGQGMGPVLIGLVLGILGAAAGGRVLESLLYQVEPLDPPTFVIVPLVFLGVAVMATALPAWAAVRIPPTEAMRVE